MTEAVDGAAGEEEAGGMESRREETGCCADGGAEPSAGDGVSDERHARAQHGDADCKADFAVVEEPAVPTIGCEIAILVGASRLLCVARV